MTRSGRLKAAIVIAWLVSAMSAVESTVHAQTRWQLDATFGDGGTATTDFAADEDSAHAILTQPDGKIVIAGYVGSEPFGLPQFALVRYTGDGTLDQDFGDGGIALARFSTAANEFSEAHAIILQPDGKIVAAGTATIGEAQEFAIARFERSGDLDATFGGDGTVTTGFGTVQDFDVRDTASALVRQTDGKIIVAGGGRLTIPNFPTVAHFNLARYLPDGTLDTSFGDNGRLVTDFAGGDDFAHAVLYYPFVDLIVAVGVAHVDGVPHVALARYDRNGSPEPVFGENGKVLTNIGGTGGLDALLQSDNKIVVVGRAAGDVAVLRYQSRGVLDETFGDNFGVVTTDFGGDSDTAFAVTLDAEDRIVVAGQASPAVADAADDFALARYRIDGSPDTTFGPGSTLRTDFTGRVDGALGVAVQADGKIVAAGFTNAGGDDITQDIAVARYAPAPEADLRIAKAASAPTVNVGETFSYTLTLTNDGPDAAARVVISDTLPPGTRFVSCETTSDGVCGGTANDRQIRYPTIPAGETRTATLVVQLEATAPDGTTITNTATVDARSVDPDPSSNTASATVTARAIPHTLRFFLHGDDVPETAGGFTMNLTPAPSRTIALNLLNAPTWFSDPTLSGIAPAGAAFRLVRPCSLGLGLLVDYRLAKVDANGGAEQILGQVSRTLGLCTGTETVLIPVATPVSFDRERLRLTISSAISVNLNLQLGEGTYFDITNFVGIP